MAVIAALVAFALLSLMLGAAPAAVRGTAGRRPEEPQPARWSRSYDRYLEGEIAALVNLLHAHLEANGGYSKSLARANVSLQAMVKPEEVRLMIAYLMAENDKIRNKSADLQENLENSRAQIEQLRSNLAEAQELGLTDPLTTLRNRRGFDLALAKEVTGALAGKDPLCLVLADIDHFKKINDDYGHPVGDEILRRFAKLLSGNVKGRDTVARYGGEEFAVILPQTEMTSAMRLASQFKHQLESQVWVVNGSEPQVAKVTASFGIAQLRENDNSRTLVQRADANLYTAKSNGRNRIAS